MKNKKSIFRTVFYIIIVLLTGCNKKEVVEYTDTPIVEAYLEPGNYLTVKVSRQIPFALSVETSSDDINNLSIQVTYNNVTHSLTSLNNGTYIDSLTTVTDGVYYNLTFSFNAKNVKAYTYIPTKPTNFTQSATEIEIERMDTTSGPPTSTTMPDPITLTWDNTDGSYYLILVENMETTLDPIRDFGDKIPPGNRFKKSPSNTSNEELRPMEFQYYGMHRIILYHVLPDYAALYTQNAANSLTLTNPSTSITNGYGIFTGLNSDTLFINVKEP
jgi:hypothetical protein